MIQAMNIPAEIIHHQQSGVYRICETNSAYDILPGGVKGPGWIFVSNELSLDEAIERHKEWEKKCPTLIYTIVPIFKPHAN